MKKEEEYLKKLNAENLPRMFNPEILKQIRDESTILVYVSEVDDDSKSQTN